MKLAEEKVSRETFFIMRTNVYLQLAGLHLNSIVPLHVECNLSAAEVEGVNVISYCRDKKKVSAETFSAMGGACNYLQLAGRYLKSIVPLHVQFKLSVAVVEGVKVIVLPVIFPSPAAVAVKSVPFQVTPDTYFVVCV